MAKNILEISYFDLHCDTAGKAFELGRVLRKNDLYVDFKRMAEFASPCAFMAVWADKSEHPTR